MRAVLIVIDMLNDMFNRSPVLAREISGTVGCELLSELDCLPVDSVIVKKRYSAFLGTNLDACLR